MRNIFNKVEWSTITGALGMILMAFTYPYADEKSLTGMEILISVAPLLSFPVIHMGWNFFVFMATENFDSGE